MERSSGITEEECARRRYHLHCLCHEGKVEKVEAYIRTFEKSFDFAQSVLDSREGVFGYSALHLAAVNGHFSVLKLLLSRGGNPNVQSKSGSTPLHLAAYRCRVECVRCLVQFKANPFVRDNNGKTANEVTNLKLIQSCLRSAGQ